MPDTSSREGFRIRLYLNSAETSVYSYDLGWVESPARAQGFEITPEEMVSGMALVREWWQHVLHREPQPITPVQETPLEYEIGLIESGPDAGKLKREIEIGELGVSCLWDPQTGKIGSCARPTFRLSPAGFDWYLNTYSLFLDAIARVRGEAG